MVSGRVEAEAAARDVLLAASPLPPSVPPTPAGQFRYFCLSGSFPLWTTDCTPTGLLPLSSTPSASAYYEYIIAAAIIPRPRVVR